MADKKDKEQDFEEDPVLPSAEIDPNEFANSKNKDEEKKDEEEEEVAEYKAPDRIPKEWPGDGAPKEEPQQIEFVWNQQFVKKQDCDTMHMLYLLQLALEKVRERTNDRNEYFKSIQRADRYINHLDAPQIITNFIEWHNQDKQKNKFDGHVYQAAKKFTIINDYISKIGKVKKGPATNIYTKLFKEVQIDRREWFDLPPKKLYLKTWGMTKLYQDETVIDEATNDQMVTLLMYDSGAPAEQKGDDEKEVVRGVLEDFALSKKDKKDPLVYLHCIGLSEEALKAEPYKFSDADAKKFADLDRNGYNQGIVRKWRHAMDRGDTGDCSDFWRLRIQAWARGETNIVPDGDFTEVKAEEPLTGKRLMSKSEKELIAECLNWLIPSAIQNHKNKETNKILNGGVSKILKNLKKVYVFGILQAAEAQQKQKK